MNALGHAHTIRSWLGGRRSDPHRTSHTLTH